MNIFRIIFLLSFVFLITSCSIPGTYIGVGNLKTPAKVEGKLAHPKIIPIDANLFTSRNNILAKNQRPVDDYRVGSYDVLGIIVWGHPELLSPTFSSNEASSQNMYQKSIGNNVSQAQGFPVDEDGYIFFPYAGNIKIAGLTIDQIRSALSNKLSHYIIAPQVSIRVTEYKSRDVHVLGEVMQPSVQHLSNKPLSILDVLNFSGGVNSGSADLTHVYIIRGDLEHLKVYLLNAKTPHTLLMASKFYLMPNDIVYVPPVGLTEWNRIVNQILPTVQTIWYTKVLIKG